MPADGISLPLGELANLMSRAVGSLILAVACIGRHTPALLGAAHWLLRKANSFCVE
jgi:hypothetical protein